MLALAGCQPLDVPAGGTAAPSGDPIDRATALTQLRELQVGSWHSMAGYSRDRFPHWITQGNGCDTREVVLRRDGSAVTVGTHCKITGGTWLSAYDGKTLSEADQLDVDHMVPLANAWRTGAASWTDDKRGAFANDLDRPQLLAVSLGSNRAKGDQDPAHWKPPNHDYWCVYAQRWIAVKLYWKLIVTSEEKTALGDMLETCP